MAQLPVAETIRESLFKARAGDNKCSPDPVLNGQLYGGRTGRALRAKRAGVSCFKFLATLPDSTFP